jgi:hypothetical protein
MTRTPVAASDGRACELPGCGESLGGHRASARYCCDAHRTSAYRARRRVQGAVGGGTSAVARRPCADAEGDHGWPLAALGTTFEDPIDARFLLDMAGAHR